ncbi:MAG: hypothetical protein LBK47_07835 [Prevotellaceae bacterium]|jgi:hypothetical protein|nr:hypothetical protein [Prevotellaceae bacterium]
MSDINAVNEQFNKELQWQIEGRLPKNHVYRLGMPNSILQAAGVTNLPIEMRAIDLALKSSMSYQKHPFNILDIKNLPIAITKPIGIFDSTKKDGAKVLFTEIKDKQNYNYTVILRVITIDRRLQVEVNSIRSLYPKDNTDGVLDWINSSDKLLRWVDKEKAFGWIRKLPPCVADVANTTKRNFATKIIQNFQNPTFDVQKNINKVTHKGPKL